MIQTVKALQQKGLPESLKVSLNEPVDENEFHNGKIYCANCIHCKLIPARTEGKSQYVLRIRCSAGKWKKKLGEEKLYKYCTITRRYLDSCDMYEEMGDTHTFMRDLKKSLPDKDELYMLLPEKV
jgi:hypothetical protein